MQTLQDKTLIASSISTFPSVKRQQLECLQVNLGYKCNLSCVHCHVNAGPQRTEMMAKETVNDILTVLKERQIQALDLTGGAPELNPHFRYLVIEARKLGVNVIDRCNLTILFEERQENLAAFLADQQVEIIASLPCYLEDNVSKQRGKGVFQQSIEAIKILNRLGYGTGGLNLNLVYNPQGAVLPPAQSDLEKDYKRVLADEYGVYFNQLFTITNVPVQRFRSVLEAHNEYQSYISLLKNNYSQSNLETVMCKTLVSVDWRGYLYDCDFNQMLDLSLQKANKKTHVRELLEFDLAESAVVVGEHCFACTAGQGSSCGGALGE